jgi:predicted SnoaL-like aldol condensation-catalyzing enzyme
MNYYTVLICFTLTLGLVGCGGSDKKKSPEKSPVPSSSSVSSSSSSSLSSSSVSSQASVVAVASGCTTMACEESNKAIVRQVYDEVMNKNNTELINVLFASDIRQHSLTTASGATGIMALVQDLKNNNPKFVATIKHIAADGDYVAVQWHLSATPSNEFSGKAVVDLYKISKGKITEQWSLSSTLNATTASGNSLFSDLFQYKGVKPAATQAVEAANKELVTSFYLGLFNDKNLDLLDKYVDPNYLQHNPYVPNGREALRGFAAGRTAGGLSFFATVSDDDIVWTFGGGDTLQLVDMFRVADKIIVEHYDLF